MVELLDRKLMNLEQLADYLGMSVSGVKKKVYKGQIPYIKIGSNNSGLRFDPEQITTMIEERTVQPFKGV